MSYKIFFIVASFSLLLSSNFAQAEFHCQIPATFPYAAVSYGGFDGNRENNQRISCNIATKYAPSYLALSGNMVFQPVTFTADGKKLYASIMKSESCNLYELTLANGAARCLGIYDLSVALGDVEVDADGNLYFVINDDSTTDGNPISKIISLDSSGSKRWETILPQQVGSGTHFSPDGYLVFQSSHGIVNLLSRNDGRPLTAPFNIPAFLGLTEIETQASTLPKIIEKYFFNNWEDAVGESDLNGFASGAGAASGASSFAGNAVGVTKGNQLLIAINSQQGGFLVAPTIKKDANLNPYLEYAWKVKLEGSGSATTPSISPDGRYVSVGDTEKGIYRINIDACNSSPSTCSYEWRYLLAANISGNPAIDENGRIYAWNQSTDATTPDFLALDTARDSSGKLIPVVAFSRTFPGASIWDSSATVYNNIILGGVTTFGTSGISHALVGLDRYKGHTVFSYSLGDDSTNNMAVGPDGAIYIPTLGMIDLFVIPTARKWQGGVRRFIPIS